MIDLGSAKIGKLKTTDPLKYNGRDDQKIKLKSGSAEINGTPMEIGREYILQHGDNIVITSASEME